MVLLRLKGPKRLDNDSGKVVRKSPSTAASLTDDEDTIRVTQKVGGVERSKTADEESSIENGMTQTSTSSVAKLSNANSKADGALSPNENIHVETQGSNLNDVEMNDSVRSDFPSQKNITDCS